MQFDRLTRLSNCLIVCRLSYGSDQPFCDKAQSRFLREWAVVLIDLESLAFAAALQTASEELSLPDYYRSCVRPLLTMPMSQWPTCCGGGCDPCAQQLVAVAERVCELLKVDCHALP